VQSVELEIEVETEYAYEAEPVNEVGLVVESSVIENVVD
jgi:hypothetical protein